MASVQWYRFDFLDDQPGRFQPGQTRTWEIDWAGGQFFGKAVVITAQPFDASNQDRSLTVTNVSLRSTDAQERNLLFTIQNNGPNTIVIYYVFMGVIVE